MSTKTNTQTMASESPYCNLKSTFGFYPDRFQQLFQGIKVFGKNNWEINGQQNCYKYSAENNQEIDDQHAFGGKWQKNIRKF